MSGSDIFHSPRVNGNKSFERGQSNTVNIWNNQVYDATFADQELSHYKLGGTLVETVLYKLN